MTSGVGPPGQTDLRRRLRRQRRDLDAATQRAHALAVAARILDHGVLGTAGRVAAYVADDGELDPSPLVSALLARSVEVFLPVADDGDRLAFGSWDGDSPLVPGRWGVSAPDSPDRVLTAAQLDVVFTPLVAVDTDGFRLGRGRGFYDRALSHRLDHPGPPHIVGLAHSFQLVATGVVRHGGDVPLDTLVTDSETLHWNRAH